MSLLLLKLLFLQCIHQLVHLGLVGLFGGGAD